MSKAAAFLAAFAAALFVITAGAPSNRSFVIDFAQNEFLKDGAVFRYISGSMHYFKIPTELWRDRLQKAKFQGLNAIQTYVQWNTIERKPGHFDFSGANNLTRYIQMAQEEDLLVILRIGPFIDAEHAHPSLRSMDPHWVAAVERYMSVLLPRIKPLLYSAGGPIISIQVENEYGSYRPECSHPQYKTHLRDLLWKHLGKDSVVYFTTDGNGDSYLQCGPVPGVLITTDYGAGTDVAKAIATLRKFQPNGPVVNSEFYSGWLDHWEERHSHVSGQQVAKTLDQMLSANMSVNIYMIHGGTHFNFTAGANLGSVYQPVPTSYDYDAPISEAGDLTEKFFLIKEVIKKHFKVTDKHHFANASAKLKLPAPVKLERKASVFDLLPHIIFTSTNPLSFEQIDHADGFMLYSTRLTHLKSSNSSSSNLTHHHLVIENGELHDRAQRFDLNFTLYHTPTSPASRLEILVENQGRICFGGAINQRKGITGRVLVDGAPLLGWAQYRLWEDWDAVVANVSGLPSTSTDVAHAYIPAFYAGKFVLPSSLKQPLDSFLDVGRAFSKGFAFLNGHNLGRYWPTAGPQVTLYAPSVYFRPPPAANELVLLEVDHSPSSNAAAEVHFTDHHVINGPVHKD
ncbi:Beta-galactosidase-1-like protein [Tyrophagus putrescentiae]|nr:Beta-galactosidase-1-like protein [Tyrophagus putrescentiae]